MKVYLAYDLAEKNPAEVVIGVGSTEEKAREAAYNYLREESELTEDDWLDYIEKFGCRDLSELKWNIVHSNRCDGDLRILIEEAFYD